MFFTWVQGFEKHILRQFTKGWVLFLSMGVLFWFLPQFIEYYLGEPPTARSRNIFKYYGIIVLVSFVLGFLSLEFQALWMRKYKVRPNQERELQRRIAILAKRAGLGEKPFLAARSGAINAAAASSVFSSAFVIVMGPLTDVLTAREEDAVFAHELAHIRHQDALAQSMILSGSRALQIQSIGLCMAVLVGVLQFQSRGAAEVGYIGSALMLTVFAHIVYQLCALGHSRAREYLADMGAIGILDEDYRDELISGMLKVAMYQTGRSPLSFLGRSGLSMFKTHPGIADRAEALRVKVVKTRLGIQLVEDKIV